MLVFAPQNQPTLDGYSEETEARVRRAEFEGGYSQRSATGPNSVGVTVPIQWVVPDADKNYIVSRFEEARGVTALQYTLPWDASPKLWTCAKWSCAPVGTRGAETVWRIRATFKQEFDVI